MNKKFLLCTLFIAKLLTAQIELVHTFNGDATFHSGDFIDTSENLLTGYNEFHLLDKENNQVSFYNTDFSLRKTITITPPNGYSLDNIFSPSINVFNNNNKVFFFLGFDSDNDNSYNLKLYNEDNEIVKDFGTSYLILFPLFISPDNSLHILLKRYESDPFSVIATEIYSVGGNTLGVRNAEKQVSTLKPYPNPTNQLINLPYKLTKTESDLLKIYDMNGKLINIKEVYNTSENLTLDVSILSTGLYIYKVGDFESKFIVK